MSGECTLLKKISTFNSNTFAIKIRKDSAIETPNKLSIWIYSQCVDVSDGKQMAINSSKKLYKEPNNELMTLETKIDGKSIFEHMAENVLSDYKNGIRTMDVEMFCSDMYYDYDGKIAKDWSKGEILQKGDIIVIKDKDNNNQFKNADGSGIIWEIVEIKIVYDGSPKLNIKLMEILKNQ